MISVVIPTYNEEKNIEKCLRAIEEQSFPRNQIEIIVVDGGSTDRTFEISGRIADKVFIQTSEGVGGARNDGFKVASGDIVATTDADCIPHENWLRSIQKKFRDPEVVAVTGILKPFDWGDMNVFEILTYSTLFKASNMALLTFSKFNKYHLCGANSAFRKVPLLEVGGYLPLAYADDIEIFNRIKEMGKIQLCKDVKMDYSVRRIRKMGLVKYMYNAAKMDLEVMVLKQKPVKGNYAKMNYD